MSCYERIIMSVKFVDNISVGGSLVKVCICARVRVRPQRCKFCKLLNVAFRGSLRVLHKHLSVTHYKKTFLKFNLSIFLMKN